LLLYLSLHCCFRSSCQGSCASDGADRQLWRQLPQVGFSTSLADLVAARSCVPSEGAGADEQLIYNFQLVDQAVLDARVVITAPEAPQNN